MNLFHDGSFSLECLQPPLPPNEVKKFSRLVNSALSEPFVSELLAGVHAQEVDCRAVRVVAGKKLVATGWTAWARSFPDIGVIAGVVTRPSYWHRGIASQVCAALCDTFDAAGGTELYLGAAAEAARRIYHCLGFQDVAGRIMRRVATGRQSFGDLVPGRSVMARSANWSDIARLVPLYVWPHECVMLDVGIRLPSVRIEPPYRCVRIFWELWETTLARSGWWHVLENDKGWLAASATARLQSRSVHVDYVRHPSYEDEAKAFLLDFVRSVEEESGLPCELIVCEGDDWKKQQANLLGFTKTRPTGGEVEIGGKRHALLAYRRIR